MGEFYPDEWEWVLPWAPLAKMKSRQKIFVPTFGLSQIWINCTCENFKNPKYFVSPQTLDLAKSKTFVLVNFQKLKKGSLVGPFRHHLGTWGFWHIDSMGI